MRGSDVIGGATYIATALLAPGIIEQTGTHRRIVLGELLHPGADLSPRVASLAEALAAADVQVEPSADARVPLWEKFIFLASLAGFCAARRPRAPCGTTRTRARCSSRAPAKSSGGPRRGGAGPCQRDRPDDQLPRRAPALDDAVDAHRPLGGQAPRGRGAAGSGRAARSHARRAHANHDTLYTTLKPHAHGAAAAGA